MQSIKFLKLRYWIIIGYAIPIILSLVSSVFVFSSVQKLDQVNEQLQIFDKVGKKLSDIAVDVQISSKTARGYLLEKSDISLNSYQEAMSDYRQIAQEIESLLIDEQQKKNFSHLMDLINQLDEFNRSLMNLVNQGKVEEAVNVWREKKGRELSEEITNAIDMIRERESLLVDEQQQQEKAALNQLIMVMIVATLLSTSIAIGLGLWIVSSITQRMNNAAGTVASSATEIAATIEQQERTAKQQAAAVHQTTTSMDELGASSRATAEQAESAASGARQALGLAENGTVAVENTIEGMENLRVKVGAIAQQIMRLSEQTNQIGNISTLVSDLANQTNMLALNAAVEAVRAGEHGKGFGVVATEIRKLADQSRRSAEKINGLVTDIQGGINATVMVTDEGTKTVQEGMRIAQETAQAFGGVQEAINHVVLNNQQISLNVQQQVKAIQQVVDAMNSLNIAAQETADGITQVKVGTQQLNLTAQEFKSIV